MQMDWIKIAYAFEEHPELCLIVALFAAVFINSIYRHAAYAATLPKKKILQVVKTVVITDGELHTIFLPRCSFLDLLKERAREAHGEEILVTRTNTVQVYARYCLNKGIVWLVKGTPDDIRAAGIRRDMG